MAKGDHAKKVRAAVQEGMQRAMEAEALVSPEQEHERALDMVQAVFDVLGQGKAKWVKDAPVFDMRPEYDLLGPPPSNLLEIEQGKAAALQIPLKDLPNFLDQGQPYSREHMETAIDAIREALLQALAPGLQSIAFIRNTDKGKLLEIQFPEGGNLDVVRPRIALNIHPLQLKAESLCGVNHATAAASGFAAMREQFMEPKGFVQEAPPTKRIGDRELPVRLGQDPMEAMLDESTHRLALEIWERMKGPRTDWDERLPYALTHEDGEVPGAEEEDLGEAPDMDADGDDDELGEDIDEVVAARMEYGDLKLKYDGDRVDRAAMALSKAIKEITDMDVTPRLVGKAQNSGGEMKDILDFEFENPNGESLDVEHVQEKLGECEHAIKMQLSRNIHDTKAVGSSMVH